MSHRTSALLLAALLSGATYAQGAAALTIESLPKGYLIPTQVQYQTTAAGIEVSGRLVKQWDRRGRILGHVSIELLDAQGRVLKEQDAALQSFTPSPKDPDWAGFSTLIEPLPAGVVGLRLRHEVGG
jgi:hypothetical protein